MGSRQAGDKRYFPKVREAREALQARALDLHDLYMTVINKAIAKGDLEVAMKATQWLMEHMPRGEGSGMVDVSIDKPAQIEQRTGPSVNIGFALGGINQKSLPTVTIDVEPVDALDAEADDDKK